MREVIISNTTNGRRTWTIEEMQRHLGKVVDFLRTAEMFGRDGPSSRRPLVSGKIGEDGRVYIQLDGGAGLTQRMETWVKGYSHALFYGSELDKTQAVRVELIKDQDDQTEEDQYRVFFASVFGLMFEPLILGDEWFIRVPPLARARIVDLLRDGQAVEWVLGTARLRAVIHENEEKPLKLGNQMRSIPLREEDRHD